MKEVFGWFHPECQRKLSELIAQNDIKSVLEIGCFLGKSTIFFAQNVETVSVIDNFIMWDEGMEDENAKHFGGDDFFQTFLSNILEAGVESKVKIYRGLSEKICEVIYDKFDLTYIDASHDYNSVLADIKNYLPKTNKIICGDDYDEHWQGVKKAVDEIFGNKARVHDNLWYVELNK